MKIFLPVLAVMLVSTLAGNAQVKARKPFPARDLSDAYETNEVLCDEKLKGRELTVIGEIQKVGKDIVGTPYVALKRRGQNLFLRSVHVHECGQGNVDEIARRANRDDLRHRAR